MWARARRSRQQRGELYAYLVALSSPVAVKTYISNIKKELNEIAPINDRNLQFIAHVTIFDKLTDDDVLHETISGLITTVKPFTIAIKGWGFFDYGLALNFNMHE